MKRGMPLRWVVESSVDRLACGVRAKVAEKTGAAAGEVRDEVERSEVAYCPVGWENGS